MAEVIVLYTPKDKGLARSAIAGLTNMRALMVPLTPGAKYFELGVRMVRVVIWSALANEQRVAEVVMGFDAYGAAPLVLALCDDTPPPEELTQAARATVAVSGAAAGQADLAAAVQALFDAEWGAPAAKPTSSVMKRNVLAAVIAGGLALGLVAGVSAWAPHFADTQGSE